MKRNEYSHPKNPIKQPVYSYRRWKERQEEKEKYKEYEALKVRQPDWGVVGVLTVSALVLLGIKLLI